MSSRLIGSGSRPWPAGHATRRSVLYGGGLVVVSATASGCGLFSTDPDTGDRVGGDKGVEAPMLAEQVEAGELPPVEERLPVNPMVVEPTERMGVYGGTWRTAITGAADGPWLHRTLGYEPLMRNNREWTEQIPNVAESIEPNEDASEFTVRLREGMRWSDGEPLTTEDVIWGYENVTLNRELQSDHPTTLARGDNPAEVEAIDDYTFVVRFDGPKATFLEDMARQVEGNRLVYYPRHYLEQFHIDFNPDADEEAQEEGFEHWVARFQFLGMPFSQQWDNPDLPTLNAWLATGLFGEGSANEFVRNPYYWKVDPEGSQLPYLDEIRYEIIPEAETMALRAQNGEFDFHSRHFNDLDHRPQLVENQESGNYRILDLDTTFSTDMVISFNLNAPGAGLREVFLEKDFRVAMSLAINRQRLIDTMWARVGEVSQPAPHPESEFYDEEFATQFTEHDPAEANRLLDALGYDERDSDGYRLRPDGERLQFTVNVANDALIDFWPDAMLLVAEDWEEVGVRAIINSINRDSWQAAMDDHDFEATVWVGEGARGSEAIRPNWYMAAGPGGGGLWASQWSGWYEARGDVDYELRNERLPAVEEQHRLYDEYLGEPDPDVRDQLFRQILEIAKENFWCIGTVRSPGPYAIVHNRLHNVGGPMPESPDYNTPAPANPEQWFIEE